MFLNAQSRLQVTLRFLEGDMKQMCLVRRSSEGLRILYILPLVHAGLLQAKFSLVIRESCTKTHPDFS